MKAMIMYRVGQWMKKAKENRHKKPQASRNVEDELMMYLERMDNEDPDDYDPEEDIKEIESSNESSMMFLKPGVAGKAPLWSQDAIFASIKFCYKCKKDTGSCNCGIVQPNGIEIQVIQKDSGKDVEEITGDRHIYLKAPPSLAEILSSHDARCVEKAHQQ